jgi:hypothetical protein
MNSARNDLSGYCVCTDDDLARLRSLIASGMDQRLASLRLWAPHAIPGRVSVSERLRARLRAVSEAGGTEALPVALLCLVGAVVLIVAGVAGR